MKIEPQIKCIRIKIQNKAKPDGVFIFCSCPKCMANYTVTTTTSGYNITSYNIIYEYSTE